MELRRRRSAPETFQFCFQFRFFSLTIRGRKVASRFVQQTEYLRTAVSERLFLFSRFCRPPAGTSTKTRERWKRLHGDGVRSWTRWLSWILDPGSEEDSAKLWMLFNLGISCFPLENQRSKVSRADPDSDSHHEEATLTGCFPSLLCCSLACDHL